MAILKDSGERRQYETGAVRDIQEGKGRLDLVPIDTIADVFLKFEDTNKIGQILKCIYNFYETQEVDYLYKAIYIFSVNYEVNLCNAILEVSKHYEDGARKYGEHNWQKGINFSSYIDSGIRHLLKYFRGDDDEPHDRAFLWNMISLAWTCIHKPELNNL